MKTGGCDDIKAPEYPIKGICHCEEVRSETEDRRGNLLIRLTRNIPEGLVCPEPFTLFTSLPLRTGSAKDAALPAGRNSFPRKPIHYLHRPPDESGGWYLRVSLDSIPASTIIVICHCEEVCRKAADRRGNLTSAEPFNLHADGHSALASRQEFLPKKAYSLPAPPPR